MNEQTTIIDLKNYIQNIRSRIFGDNKAGLTDPAKIFEGIVASLYNIKYQVDDFSGFEKSNNPIIDIKSDLAKVVVSVKARENYQSQTQIDATVEAFKFKYPKLVNYSLISQQLCDKPTKIVSNEKITIWYFNDLINLFNDNSQKLKAVNDWLNNNRKNPITRSYLNMINDKHLRHIRSWIYEIFGIQTYNIYETVNLNEIKFTRENFMNFEQVLYPAIKELWNEIDKKQYLQLGVSDLGIEFMDSLWSIGLANNRFLPINPKNILNEFTDEIWDAQIISSSSVVLGTLVYFIKLDEKCSELNIMLKQNSL